MTEGTTSRTDLTPKAVQDCHELLLWLIPVIDQFPRVRRFTLGERLEYRRVRCADHFNVVISIRLAPSTMRGTIASGKMVRAADPARFHPFR